MGVDFPSEDMEGSTKSSDKVPGAESPGGKPCKDKEISIEDGDQNESETANGDKNQQQNGVDSDEVTFENAEDSVEGGKVDSKDNGVGSELESESVDDCEIKAPPGWKRLIMPCGSESASGKNDVCYESPLGKMLRSLVEVKKHCEEEGLEIDFNKIVFSSSHSKPINEMEQTNGCSRSNSPVPETRRSVSPNPGSVASSEQNSDSQTSFDSTSDNTKKTEKKAVTTSALLRAYRPHQKSGLRNQSKQQSSSGPSSEKTPAQKRKATEEATQGLIMECKSEGLSSVQFNKIQKLQEEIARLQLYLWDGVSQRNKNGTAPVVNGAVGGSSPSVPLGQALTNGSNLVGLQVPQFLLFQNGQMVGASTIAATTKQTVTTTPGATFSGTTSSSVSHPQTASHNTKNTTNKPAQDKNHTPAVRSQRIMNRQAAAANNNRNSPDIQVLREMRVPTHIQGTPSSGATPSTSGTSSGGSSPKNFPLLSIVCRPRNTLSPSVSMFQRKELDVKVKSVLVKSAQEFVEWLLGEGLIRTSQYCSIHKLQPSQLPFKLKLGMFSDPKVLSTSGGYVWISECCGKKYVSVYSGSIFGSTPIDKVAPTAVLKLIYHWSCQTSISNVESWVKVDKGFINKIYNYLRCVCSVMLQDKVYDFGFDGTTVELGIVSLGTSTADGTKKAVKVEILGLYDRKMKSYRLFASEPEPGSSSRQRFIRILKPLERVVHTNAIILCDQSVDRNCLYNMNYGKVSVCETSDNEENLQSNAKIMSYLRKHVPKMFQSTLSQLQLQQVQIVLDELCWRERFGHCSAQAYTSMIEHITYLTSREAENPGVLHLLDFVAQKPHHNWRYKSQHVTRALPALQPSIIMSTPVTGTINPQVTIDVPVSAQSPLEHTNKVALTPRRGNTMVPKDMPPPTTQIPVPVGNTSSLSMKPDAVELEPFYYGQIQGDSSLGREFNNYTFNCHLCNQETFGNNIEFYTHLKSHLGNHNPELTFCCDYCTEHFSTQENKDYHSKFRHQQMDTRYTWCRICTESFTGEFQLVNHMAKKHYESELPYRCEVCNFTSSIYFSIINHFRVEHKDSPYVQCHYCLSVKILTSSSASSFSFRMLQHLQKHANQQGKCKSCCLSFYSKYLLDEHKRKDHISRSNVIGLQRYKVPVGHDKIMFRPYVKRGLSNTTQPTIQLQASNTIALSTTAQRLDSLTVDLGAEEKQYYCLECDANFDLDQHFHAYQKCTKCRYSTCCRNMISKHAQVFHPNGKNKNAFYRIGPPVVLSKPLYCICSFSTRSGNHMARHLALCEGGRKSAYPSLMDAMVYRGDPMTPSALALSSLGLTRMLPGSVTPNVPQEETLDMTHFMSMSMHVDDDADDPPLIPVAVELKD